MRVHESTNQKSCRPLTKKEQAFVREYLIDQNAAKAARKAGYSTACARQLGHETLSKPDLATAVQAGLDLLASHTETMAEKVLREIAAVAFASASHFVEAADGALVAEEGAEGSGAALQIRHRRIKKNDGI
jgi:phage terminase small subunit